MKNTSLTLLIALFVSLCFASCQKEVSTELGNQTGGTGNNNGGGSKSSYGPTTAGTWWKYKDTATGTISTLTVLDVTSAINGIVFKGLESSNATIKDTAAWMASPQPQYYLYEKGISPNTGASFDMLFHYLNDTAAVGSSWTYTAGQGNGFTAQMQTTIVEKGISMTVQGKNYDDVIHTNLALSYDVYGSALDAMVYDIYVAKGVGIIKTRSTGLTLMSGFEACSDLVDYRIK